jgi:tetrapyrrole methylase family protein/MazG family protein
MSGHVVVVGLGPAGADLVTPRALAALGGAARRFTRTARHPAVAELEAAGMGFHSFDAVYDGAADLDAVYPTIVRELVEVAGTTAGAVAFAVPGSPAVAERTVALLREEAQAGRITLEVVAGLSFAELAWPAVGVDPMDSGARVVDGRALDLAALEEGVPLLVAQCDSRLVLSEVKLTLLERLDAATELVVLQRLGLADERGRRVGREDLDRDVEPDHLTAVYVPAPALAAAREVARLVALAERLRGPGGCPWDAAQTHHSLTRHLLEESYETVDALEQLPADAPEGVAADDPRYAAVADELGDVLFQVVIHTVLASEAGAFTMADVARGIHDKLVRRHPHVFGEVEVAGADDVVRNWEQIKKEEQGADSLVAGISPGLPSLLYVHKLLRKGASVGLDVTSVDEPLAVITAVGDRLGHEAPDAAVLVGELLGSAASLAGALGVDAESALQAWAGRWRARFEAMERLAAERGLDLHRLPPEEVAALWSEAGSPRSTQATVAQPYSAEVLHTGTPLVDVTSVAEALEQLDDV